MYTGLFAALPLTHLRQTFAGTEAPQRVCIPGTDLQGTRLLRFLAALAAKHTQVGVLTDKQPGRKAPQQKVVARLLSSHRLSRDKWWAPCVRGRETRTRWAMAGIKR